jgi:hypothetical protein
MNHIAKSLSELESELFEADFAMVGGMEAEIGGGSGGAAPGEDPGAVTRRQERIARTPNPEDQLKVRYRMLALRHKALLKEYERLALLNDRLAEALGSCPACWGETHECEECGGGTHGRPGAQPPNAALFKEFAEPAVRWVASGRLSRRAAPKICAPLDTTSSRPKNR